MDWGCVLCWGWWWCLVCLGCWCLVVVFCFGCFLLLIGLLFWCCCVFDLFLFVCVFLFVGVLVFFCVLVGLGVCCWLLVFSRVPLFSPVTRLRRFRLTIASPYVCFVVVLCWFCGWVWGGCVCFFCVLFVVWSFFVCGFRGCGVVLCFFFFFLCFFLCVFVFLVGVLRFFFFFLLFVVHCVLGGGMVCLVCLWFGCTVFFGVFWVFCVVPGFFWLFCCFCCFLWWVMFLLVTRRASSLHFSHPPGGTPPSWGSGVFPVSLHSLYFPSFVSFVLFFVRCSVWGFYRFLPAAYFFLQALFWFTGVIRHEVHRIFYCFLLGSVPFIHLVYSRSLSLCGVTIVLQVGGLLVLFFSLVCSFLVTATYHPGSVFCLVLPMVSASPRLFLHSWCLGRWWSLTLFFHDLVRFYAV